MTDSPDRSSAPPQAKPARAAVGFMQGRGGDETLTPSEALQEWRSEAEALGERLAELFREVECIELAMADAAALLGASQPPMYGRMAIRWWRLFGGGRRTPVLVKETGGARGQIKPERVKTRGVRQRTDLGFSLNADLAKRGIDAYWSLSHIRDGVLQEIARIKRALAGAKEPRREAVVRIRAELVMLQEEARDRLVDVGHIRPVDQ
ncbi:TPA: hypothetical protein ACKPYM_000761 [Stenotrophomonas maltophilia]